MKISIKQNKSLMKNFIFCAVENEVIRNVIIVSEVYFSSTFYSEFPWSPLISHIFWRLSNPKHSYPFKVNKSNTREKRGEICSKITIKVPE